jgi:hypothetical protein
MLENRLWEESMNCIEHAKSEIVSNEPEALVLRAIGIEEAKLRENACHQ